MATAPTPAQSGLTQQQYNQLSNLLFNEITPQVGLENQAVNLAQAQGALIPQQTALEQSYAGQQYQNALANQALQQQGLAGEQQYLGTQEAIAPQQYALTTGGLQQQLQELAFNYPLAVQQQQGAAAAQGASNTVGNRNALAQLAAYSNPDTGFAAQDIQRSLAQAGLSNQLQNASFGLQNLQTGLPGQNSLSQQALNLQNQALGQQYQYNLANSQLQGAFGYLGAQQGVLGQQAGIEGQIIQNQAPLGLLQMAVQNGGTGQSGN